MDNKNSANQLVSSLENVFKKLPALPPQAVDVLVTITPWIALIFGVLGVLAGVAGLGVLSVLVPVAFLSSVPSYGSGFIPATGVIVSSALMLMAYPGLSKQKAGGWNLLFWSEVVSIVVSVVGIVTAPSGIIGSVLAALVGLYILFQIKPRYNK